MAKTGIKIKRCNVGSVEAHNKRTKEYLEGLEKAGKPLYYFPELTPDNVSWENPRYEGKSCQTLFEEAKALYKEKVGQAPQLKDRERISKKTGKKKIIAGWSPIREGCPPIKEDTTIEDFKPVVDWARDNGLDVIRIDLHFDEGHDDAETKERKLNRHAHIVFDWVDHNTGKTIKLDDAKMSELQDIMAAALGMERGIPKVETGLEHIPAAEYRERKAAESARKLEVKSEDLESTNKQLKQENDSLLEERAEIVSVVETETQLMNRLQKTNKDLEHAQNCFVRHISDEFERLVREAKAEIENASVKISLFGSGKDRDARRAFREQLIASLDEILKNPSAHLADIKKLPDDIRQEYRRMDEHAENNRRENNYHRVDDPAIRQTNADLRKRYQREASLLDEMNLQQLPEDVKERLINGESVKVRKKWYDPTDSKFTDEEEATLNVSEWRLRFNGKSLREFLTQVWMKMAMIAQEVKRAAWRKSVQEKVQEEKNGMSL